ncbi:small heat shock protein, chloroplastic-like [Carex rostrata]
MAVASPCALASRLTSRIMARPMVMAPRCFGNEVRLRPMSAASAMPQRHEDSAVSLQVDRNSNGKKSGKQAVQRQPRRAALDISPFGLMDPYSPMKTMRQMLDSMDRLFEDTMAYPGTVTRRSQNNGGRGEVRAPWDIMEDENEVKMRFDMPGLSKEEVKISVQDDMLVIKGEHKKEEGTGEKGEWWKRGARTYDMQLLLPDECDKSKVAAEFKNGVLLVTVPKGRVERKVFDVEIK